MTTIDQARQIVNLSETIEERHQEIEDLQIEILGHKRQIAIEQAKLDALTGKTDDTIRAGDFVRHESTRSIYEVLSVIGDIRGNIRMKFKGYERYGHAWMTPYYTKVS